MFESLFTSFDNTDSLFDQFRRLENQMDQLFSYSPWPAGIRAVQRGTFPPLNVGSTPERVDVYVFAANLDPKKLDLSIQQNLLWRWTRRRSTTGASASMGNSGAWSRCQMMSTRSALKRSTAMVFCTSRFSATSLHARGRLR
jgi:hypothetical protein